MYVVYYYKHFTIDTTISMIENKMFEKFSQLKFILLNC